jgi:hypothetical protein
MTDSRPTDDMAARYFGAGPGSARRRRRLVIAAKAQRTDSALSPARLSRVVQDQTELHRTRLITPLNSLIHPRPWVNWILVTLALGVWTSVVTMGWLSDQTGRSQSSVLSLRNGRLLSLFGNTALLAATQLSLVILWYRTRSRKDFEGRYRIWIWSSLIWALFFAAAVSGRHVLLAERTAAFIPRQVRPSSVAMWLVPAAIAFGTTIRVLRHDMTAASARMLLTATVAVATVLATAMLIPVLPVAVAPGFAAAASALWPILLASALLHHARYVIHVSNEATVRRYVGGRSDHSVMTQIWKEVLTLLPSQATIAHSPIRVWTACCWLGRGLGLFSRFLMNWLKTVRRRHR